MKYFIIALGILILVLIANKLIINGEENMVEESSLNHTTQISPEPSGVKASAGDPKWDEEEEE